MPIALLGDNPRGKLANVVECVAMKPPYPVAASPLDAVLRPLGLAYLPYAAAGFLRNLLLGGKTPNRKALRLMGREFLEYSQRSDFPVKRAALLSALDAKSAATTVTVFERFLHLAQHDHQPDLSPCERRAQWRSYQDLCGLIIPRYRLAAAFHETCVFNYHCGLAGLSAKLPSAARHFLRGRDVIDAGAFIGDSALMFLREYSVGKVWAFEPDEENFRLLNKTIALNHETRIHPQRCGLAAEAGEQTMVSQGSASFVTSGGIEGPRVRLVTIDEFVSGQPMDVGLIKMDIEGYESSALRGATETIRKFRPILLISIYHNPVDFFEIKPWLEQLGLGYSFLVRKINAYEPVYETMLIALPRSFDGVCDS